MIVLSELCAQFTAELNKIFSDAEAGLETREDSRAFGAMIERRISDQWSKICIDCGADALPQAGRRSIYDFACIFDGKKLGFDVKTKDLDSGRYSDGGVCSVGNLLKFLANDTSLFFVIEFGHRKMRTVEQFRKVSYIHVAPFHALPERAYRIENLGTGQIRLDFTINELMENIEWDRSVHSFLALFTALAVNHYERVIQVSEMRIESLRKFQSGSYRELIFK